MPFDKTFEFDNGSGLVGPDCCIDVWSWHDDDPEEPRAIVGLRVNDGAYEAGTGRYLPGATITMNARNARAIGEALITAASIAALDAMLGAIPD